MAKTKEEREQHRLEAKERSLKRKALKSTKQSITTIDDAPKLDTSALLSNLPFSKEHNATLPPLQLPIDALCKILRYLPARELGALALTCGYYNGNLGACRASHLCCRLMGREEEVGRMNVCGGRKEAMVSFGLHP
jgi:hypothetical protein